MKYLKESASIINICSGVSRVTPPKQAPSYYRHKGALDAITGVLARELGPRNVRAFGLDHRRG